MAKSDLEKTWETIVHDFEEIARPLFSDLADQLKSDSVNEGKVTVGIQLVHNQKTGDYVLVISGKSAAGNKKITHKATLDNRQLVLL